MTFPWKYSADMMDKIYVRNSNFPENRSAGTGMVYFRDEIYVQWSFESLPIHISPLFLEIELSLVILWSSWVARICKGGGRVAWRM